MSVLSILQTIAPDLASDPNVQDNIALAELQTNRCWYGAKADYAVALRTAHNMSLNTSPLRSNGEAGAVTTKKEGDLSISFGKTGNSKSNDPLDQTHYGIQLKKLRMSSGPFLGVTGGNGRVTC